VKTAAAAKPAPAKTKAERLVLRGITITHPDRVISEDGHVTKGELAEYYAGVADFILPQIVERPLSLLKPMHSALFRRPLKFCCPTWLSNPHKPKFSASTVDTPERHSISRSSYGRSYT